jgi:8-oxo-dGTP diphosphatase
MLSRDVLAAGAVVVRAKGAEVLLVHRPKYDDWSFPKGKLDAGEHVAAAAVREVREESGVDIRLGVPLPIQRYGLGNERQKVVHYWIGHPVAGHDVEFVPNSEVDQICWVGWAEAEQLLSYRRDRAILAAARELGAPTYPMVVLRHGKAVARREWTVGLSDRGRPLDSWGRSQAEDVVDLLAAFGVRTVHASTSTRCLETVLPYARAVGANLSGYECLTEEGADEHAIDALVADLVVRREAAVVCSHRPVLPAVFAALGRPNVKLAPGELWVAHLRKSTILGAQTMLPGESVPQA